MRVRRLLLAGCAMLAILSAGGVSGATHTCASYSVTAPVVGTQAGTKCSPVPTTYTHPFYIRYCGGVPPAGVAYCVIADLHTP